MIKKTFFHLLMLCLIAVLACAPALAAQEIFTIDVDALDLNRLNSDSYVQDHLSASAQGIRIRKHISDSSELAAPIRLTLTQMNTQTVVLDRDCGYQSGTFDSGTLYLPGSSGQTTPYLITLYAGNYVYAVPFMQTQSRPSAPASRAEPADDWADAAPSSGWSDEDYGWSDDWSSDADGWADGW